MGKGDQKEDKELIPDSDAREYDVETSKKIVASLPLEIRTKRDMAIDYMNPEETLPAFVSTIDENPAFGFSTLTMIAPSDDIARQTITMLQTGRANYLKEENKYNASWEENSEGLPSQAPTYADLESMIQKNIDMQHQEAIDQTSSL